MAKEFSISKQKADRVQGLFSLLVQKKTVVNLLDKEIQSYVKNEVLPDVGLEPEDFKYINLDVSSGTLTFDEEKKEKDKEVDTIAEKEDE